MTIKPLTMHQFIIYWYVECISAGYKSKEAHIHLIQELCLPRGTVGAILLQFRRDIGQTV